MKSHFTNEHLDTLRKAYAVVRNMRRGGPSHTKLTTMLGKLHKTTLTQLADAGIRWVSYEAALILGRNPEMTGGHPRDNGTGWIKKDTAQ